MVDVFLQPRDHGPAVETVLAFRHWIHGFTLQTLIYGINIVLFLMSTWVLIIHILKGSTSNRFHRYHLFQNCILLVYVVVMFALSTVFMGHQGVMVRDAWFQFLAPQGGQSSESIVAKTFADRAMQRAGNAIFILVNWGTVGLLLWRCVLHYKVRSVFPSEAMTLPYLLFASNIATGLIRIINDSTPQMLSQSTKDRNWALIHWSLATALYYLLSFLIFARVVYRRYIIGRDIGGSEIGHFASFLTIFYESGAIVLAFSTVYLIILARFPDLKDIFQPTTVQAQASCSSNISHSIVGDRYIQVMLSLSIVQRVAVGKAWAGKTIDCILNSESKPDTRHEEVSTMGFNPNTEFSRTQNDYDYSSDHCLDSKGHHDLTTELRVIKSKV
ncbi:hypothetical protein AN958_06901 [Leucoagaricus sp. SymC.cos]|nr:hypothetical protein AN958_06901 [Leucoagaricus sp. SymC.cos]